MTVIHNSGNEVQNLNEVSNRVFHALAPVPRLNALNIEMELDSSTTIYTCNVSTETCAINWELG